MPTIIVEDGGVVDGANSFVALDDADAFHADRGNTDWSAASDSGRQVALIRAGQYLNGLPWKGAKTDPDNPMAWPRQAVVDGDGFEVADNAVPARVAMAQCEAALREIAEAGALEPDLAQGGLLKRQKVDVIESEYFGPGRTRFTAVESLLSGLVRPGCAMAVRRA